MLFAEKGLWDVAGEQAPGVVSLLLAFGMVLLFLWKLVVRYGDPFINHLRGTGDKIDKLVESNSCIPNLAADVKRVVTKMGEWPSNLKEKLEEARCASIPMTREEAKAYLKELSEAKKNENKGAEHGG